MGLHLIKLCVGVSDVENLIARQRMRRRHAYGNGIEHPYHVTRMMPRRADELIDGGSLYWVIKGVIAVRQQILSITAIVDSDGVSRARLEFSPELVRTEMWPRRAFQGWRYLKSDDAPPDLPATPEDAFLAELAKAGL